MSSTSCTGVTATDHSLQSKQRHCWQLTGSYCRITTPFGSSASHRDVGLERTVAVCRCVWAHVHSPLGERSINLEEKMGPKRGLLRTTNQVQRLVKSKKTSYERLAFETALLMVKRRVQQRAITLQQASLLLVDLQAARSSKPTESSE
jgi:hypothetical protein